MLSLKYFVILLVVVIIQVCAGKTPESHIKHDPNSKCITIGKLKNCQHVIPLGYYELPSIKDCAHIDEHRQNLTTFQAKILRYNPTVTTFSIYLCSLHFKMTSCSLDGSTSVRWKRDKISRKNCGDMLLYDESFGYYKEKLYWIRPGLWRSKPKQPDTCRFLRGSWTHYEAHYTLQAYPAKLIGNSSLIEQQVTTLNLYANFTTSNRLQFSTPAESASLVMVWKTSHVKAHDRVEIKPVSDFVLVQKISNFIHVPKLDIGGEISLNHPLAKQNKNNRHWYCLDNGIIVEGNGTKIDYRKSQMKEIVFLAKKFASEQGLPLIQAHLVENLVNIKQQAIREAKRTCFIQKEIRNLHKWLSTHFPDMISELVFGRADIIAHPAGDAYAVSECTDISYRCLKLDRRNPLDSINNSCYQYFPLEVAKNRGNYFVEIPSRKVYNHSPKIDCSKLPPETIIKSDQGVIAVEPNGTFEEIKLTPTEYSPNLWMTPLKHAHGYDKGIFVELPKRNPPYPVLGLLSEVHEGLRELQSEIDKGNSPSVFAGIASGVGSILESAGKGTSEVIRALGVSIKSASEGVGTLSKDIISSSGNALADTIGASGSAIKDVEDGGADILNSVFGGIPGILGLCALVLILGLVTFLCYKNYKKGSNQTQQTLGLNTQVTDGPSKNSIPQLENSESNEEAENQDENKTLIPSGKPNVIYELVNNPELLDQLSSKLEETQFQS